MGIVIDFPLRNHARASTGCRKLNKAGSISRGRTASEKTKKYSDGMPRARQLTGALADSRPAKEQTPEFPPKAEMSSSKEEIMLITHRDNSRSVSTSSPHNSGLEKASDSDASAGMYSKAESAKRLVLTQEALELTNEAISSKLGVASNAWAQYRTGKRTIPHTVIVGLKEQFGVSSDWILAGDPSGLPQRIYARLRVAA